MASTELIRGENMVLIVDGKAIGCARTCSLNRKVNLIGKSTIGSGSDKEYKAVSREWSISSDGLLKIVDVTNNNYQDLTTIFEEMLPVLVAVTLTDISANTFNSYGNAIMVELNASGSVNNIGVYNVTLQGTGSLYKLLPPTISLVVKVVDGGDPTIVHVTVYFTLIPEATSYTLQHGYGVTTVATIAGILYSSHTFDALAADFPVGTSWVQMKAIYPAGDSPYSAQYVL